MEGGGGFVWVEVGEGEFGMEGVVVGDWVSGMREVVMGGAEEAGVSLSLLSGGDGGVPFFFFISSS